MPLIKPAAFQRLLLQWFDTYGRKHLPWQQDKSPYRVWISEIMLQQTQVATVIPYFERFMAAFPTVTALAEAHEDEVLHLWAGLGYYSRARNLHRAAAMICDAFNGQFPDDQANLISLPGIGPSTANAILSIAFNQPMAILDGNVKRVLARVFAIAEPINVKSTEAALWQLAQSYMPKVRTGDYTQAIMDLGATLCIQRRPNCTQCALRQHCQAYQQNAVHLLPYKKAKNAIPTKARTFFIFQQGRKVLLYKRPAKGIWGGLWSLPEAECLPDADLLKPLSKKEVVMLQAFRHTFTHYHLQLHPVMIQVKKIPAAFLPKKATTAWYDLTQPPALGLPRPIQTILQMIKGVE